MKIEMARLLCLKAAYMMDTVGQRDASPWISQIKVIAPRIALEITDEAVQMHGAMGITQDTPLAHMWTHLRTLRLADGPDAVHRRQVARAELRALHEPEDLRCSCAPAPPPCGEWPGVRVLDLACGAVRSRAASLTLARAVGASRRAKQRPATAATEDLA